VFVLCERVVPKEHSAFCDSWKQIPEVVLRGGQNMPNMSLSVVSLTLSLVSLFLSLLLSQRISRCDKNGLYLKDFSYFAKLFSEIQIW